MPKPDIDRSMVFVDCDVLGRGPEWNGHRLTIEGYVMIPREKFWRYWALAAYVRLFRFKPAEHPLNEAIGERP